MIFTTAVIADIHFGAVKPDQLYHELKNEFLNFIKDRYIDMIVIAGDFFNSITTLNSHSTLTAFSFMRELVSICEDNDIKYIRIIEGTLSHDNFQILNFRSYENNKNVNFKIITKVISEELDNGIKILYIPEEYMDNFKDYYKEYLDKPKKYYDFIFGHGMFKETSFTKDDSESEISKAPIWDSKLLISLCKGPIFFGHIHTSQIIRKHIYYTGSFSRWVYGQEENKGFYIFTYDTESFKYLTQFIVNKLAKEYNTFTVHFEQMMKKYSLEDFIKKCKEFKGDNNLRIIILLSELSKDYSYELAYIKEYFSGKPNYKIEIVDTREVIEKEKTEAKVNQLLSDYNFLFENIPVYVKISKFIKRKYSKEVSEEKIKDLLNLNIEKADKQ